MSGYGLLGYCEECPHTLAKHSIIQIKTTTLQVHKRLFDGCLQADVSVGLHKQVFYFWCGVVTNWGVLYVELPHRIIVQNRD